MTGRWWCGLLLLAGTGCGAGEDLTAPVLGALAIATHTSGSAIDPDGYGIRIDGGDPHPVGSTGSVVVPGLTPGEHAIEVLDVASTCSLADPNPRIVNVTPSSTIRVSFTVICSAAPEVGRLQVTVITAGSNPDPDGYVAVTDPSESQPLAANDTVIFDSVPAGPRLVRLTGVAGNCAARPDPDTVTVAANDTVRSSFEVTCWPPLVGRIAFSRSGDILVQRADGRGMQQLTGQDDPDDPANPLKVTDEQPVWSPDGTKLAFVRDFTLFTMDADGSNAARITPDTQTVLQELPKWAPDGQKLLFLGDRTDFGGALYTIKADGTGVTRLPLGNVLWASWSPDARRLAAILVSFSEETSLFLLNPDGTGMVDITPVGQPFLSAVEWSPDGSRFALVVGNVSGGGVFLSDTLGASLTPVVTRQVGVGSVTWSPDGLRLAFPMTLSQGSSQIFIANRDGSGLVELTGLPLDPFVDFHKSDEDPAWGP